MRPLWISLVGSPESEWQLSCFKRGFWKASLQESRDNLWILSSRGFRKIAKSNWEVEPLRVGSHSSYVHLHGKFILTGLNPFCIYGFGWFLKLPSSAQCCLDSWSVRPVLLQGIPLLCYTAHLAGRTNAHFSGECSLAWISLLLFLHRQS